MMRMVAQAAEICKSKLGAGLKAANAEVIQKWLATYVKRGVHLCLDVATVKRRLDNWTLIQKHIRVVQLIEAAVQHWGRDNLLASPRSSR